MTLLNLGLDATDISRIRRILKGPRREAFLDRILSPAERTTLRALDPRSPREAEWVAGRFAAKEAVMKVLKSGTRLKGRFVDIVVAKARSGAPRIRLQGRLRLTAQTLGISDFLISITHTKTQALAMVGALGTVGKRRRI